MSKTLTSDTDSSQQWPQRAEEFFLQRLADKLDGYTKQAEAQDYIDWIETHFLVPEPRDPITGVILPPGPIRLTDEQKIFIREAVRKDEDGLFIYTTILYSCPKKSGKTTLAAAVLLAFVDIECYLDVVYCLANDGKGAEDRMFGAIVKCLSLHQKLGGAFATIKPLRNKITWLNGTVIEAIPVDPSGEAGSEPRATFWSELWGFSSAFIHKERLWTELTIPPTKWGRAIRWVESYAGFEGESRTLENLYRLGVLEGTHHPDFAQNYPVTVNESARLLCYWDHEPRMPWQTEDYYEQEANILPASEFDRIHRNQWQRSITAFTQEIHWRKCNDGSIEPLPLLDMTLTCPYCSTQYPLEAYGAQAWLCQQCGGRLKPDSIANFDSVPVVIAADIATEGDCASLVACTRHPDPERAEKEVALRAAATFYPPVNLSNSVEQIIRLWCAQWNVVVCAYDPFQMKKLAQDLQAENIVWFNEFSQGDRRAIADKKLQDMIRARQVVYNGGLDAQGFVITPGLEDITQHLMNAGSKFAGSSRLRIVKQQNSKKPIDGAVALSMGVDECLRLLI